MYNNCIWFKFFWTGCYQFLFSKHERWKWKLSPTSQTTWWMHLVSKNPFSFQYFVPMACSVYRMSFNWSNFSFICFYSWTMNVTLTFLSSNLGMLRTIHSMQNLVFTCLNFGNSRYINFTSRNCLLIFGKLLALLFLSMVQICPWISHVW